MRSSALAIAAATSMAGHALAQSSTATPTVSIYLPFGGHNLAASVITAAPSSTVYAIACEQQSGACAPGCSLDSTVTITEGESTLRYTWTDGYRAAIAPSGSSLVQDVTTVACNLHGGTRATSAVCTGYSAVDDLGNGTQTTTLASSQISYVPVTVTAGADNMAAASSGASTGAGTGTSTASGSSSGSSMGAAAATATNAASPWISPSMRCGAWLAAGLGAFLML